MLLDAHGRCKIADLGLSRTDDAFDVARVANIEQRREEEGTRIDWTAAGGTAPYMSPDVANEYLERSQMLRSGRPRPCVDKERTQERKKWVTSIPVDISGNIRLTTDSFSSENPGPTGPTLPAIEETVVSSQTTEKGETEDYMRHVEEAAASKQRKSRSLGRRSSSGSRGLGTWYSPDAYAFGILAWEVLTLRPPWAGCVMANQIWLRVRQGERPEVTEADEASAPVGYVELVRELWAQNPVERPTFAETLQRLEAMRTPITVPPAAATGELDLVSDLFEKGGNEAAEGDEAEMLRSLQYLGSTPTAGDYALTLGHALIDEPEVA